MVQSIPWYVAVFESIPETFLVLMLGFALFNYRIKPKEALMISFITAACSYWIHRLPIIFGMHTVLLTILCIFVTVHIASKEWLKTALSVIVGVTLSILLQGLLVPLVFASSHLNLQTLQLHPWFYIVVFLPTCVIMTVLYILIRKKGFYIIDFDTRSDEVEEV